MRVQYFGYEYEMAEHSHFNNEVTTAKLLTEKNCNQTVKFFQNNYHKTHGSACFKGDEVRVLKATKQVH